MKDIILMFFAFLVFHFGIVLAACMNLLIHYYSGNWLLYWGVLHEGWAKHLIWFVIIIFLTRLKNGKKDNK